MYLKNQIKLLFLYLIIFYPVFVVAQNQAGEKVGKQKITKEGIEDIVKIISETRELIFNPILKTFPKHSKMKEVVAVNNKLTEYSKYEYFDLALLLYRAECLKLMRQKEKVKKIFDKAVSKNIEVPDFYLVSSNIIEKKQKGLGERIIETNEPWKEYGELVPISLIGLWRDKRLTFAPKAFRGDLPPRIPKRRQFHKLILTLMEIGKLYDEMGLTREAINVYLEAFYCIGPPYYTAYPKEESVMWIRIGNLEIKNNNPLLAIRAFLKSVYMDKERAKEAAEGILKAINLDKDQPAPKEEHKWDRVSVEKIAKKYREFNLYPFSLKILEAAEKETDEKYTALKEEIKKEWDKLLVSYKYLRRNFIILGVKLYSVKDWSKANIKRPSDTFWMPIKTENK